ncbi:flagellar hook assembly protein FlgD [Pigmentiphaga sp.]|uniref:flagellar hook assembly protein FlgD n=1 Tax=Pigmentiphaga sp. TaxID=1977564 RepID=UPI00128D20F8|nr:flagellar hook assembly protein FlgD [Pigmentiphaga sp.]MPS30386.1 flagellar hook assembly protein FlgD [Alcaligenaceae bacterium SAGV5]MPS50375.1 flagellar hook assembly protein FlgD [Alcaligenaceae bacterium SAGV3]MPT57481.1 flagellar hook assembly protein FlgD [Alcaligenaceae bacterium]
MAVSNVNSNTGTNATGNSLAASSAEELSNRFLTMLTAQMRNQDPLNPLDNAELTSQLAQISTVTGISQLNTTMQWLGYSMGSLQATQAASLIGRKVMLSGDGLTLADGKAEGGYVLSIPVESAELVVKDADGVEVARKKLTDVEAGVHTFTWDGKNAKGDTLPDGDYKFEVQVGEGTKVGAAPPLSVTQITSVRPSSGSTTVVDAKGNLVNLSDVYQVW